MSQYVIEIDDKSVTDQINGIINAVFKREINNKYGETGRKYHGRSKILYIHTKMKSLIRLLIEPSKNSLEKDCLNYWRWVSALAHPKMMR